MVVCDYNTDYMRESVNHSFSLYVQIPKPIFLLGFLRKGSFDSPITKK
jgi:hypothetical protein